MNDVEANVSRPEPTDDPRGRARLVIAPLVVERVVDGAARRVPGVRAVPGRLGRDALRVEAKVLGRVASVSLDIGVGYPSPVRAKSDRPDASAPGPDPRTPDLPHPDLPGGTP